MKFSNQIQSYLSELSDRLRKTEQEIIEIALFNLYNDHNAFVKSPYSKDMWLKEELTGDDVIEITDSTGKSFKWIQYPDTQESRKLIGNRIKQLREEAGWTQEDLAEKVELKQANIARIETAKYSTGQDILSRIAKTFGKRLDII